MIYMHTLRIILFILHYQWSFIQCTSNRIYFPGEENLTLGSACNVSPSIKGTCKFLAECQELASGDIPVTLCSPLEAAGLTACCPDQAAGTQHTQSETKISAPILYWDPLDVYCGSPYNLAYHYGNIIDETEDIGSKSFVIYHLNETADRLRSEGFTVNVLNMYGDAIWNMTYTNGSFTETIGYDYYSGALAVGGKPAPEQMAFFMALLGQKKGNETNWVCDGVVLNREWILTAAHCFLERGITPDVVRLGDYDWNLQDEGELRDHFKPIDFAIADILIYPDFNVDERYHDIALVKISKPYPMFARNINPVCLPWDDDTILDIVGYNVTLSGWGATKFGAGSTKTNILQAVELNVFPTSRCQESYSKLLDFRFKWPQGLTPDKILCVGWDEGGRDACKGDSGGPLTYLNSTTNRFTLAGIVSTGFGCGLKEYPGIYIPINNPTYLSWIKRVAFDGFLDTADSDYFYRPWCWTSPTEKTKEAPGEECSRAYAIPECICPFHI